MMAPKKMTPAGGALLRRATWIAIKRTANDPMTLIAPTPALAAGVRLRQNLRAVSTAGFRVNASTALCTRAIREDGQVVAPLSQLIALAAVGGDIGPGLVVD